VVWGLGLLRCSPLAAAPRPWRQAGLLRPLLPPPRTRKKARGPWGLTPLLPRGLSCFLFLLLLLLMLRLLRLLAMMVVVLTTTILLLLLPAWPPRRQGRGAAATFFLVVPGMDLNGGDSGDDKGGAWEEAASASHALVGRLAAAYCSASCSAAGRR
jgi:hypothetical protein